MEFSNARFPAESDAFVIFIAADRYARPENRHEADKVIVILQVARAVSSLWMLAIPTFEMPERYPVICASPAVSRFYSFRGVSGRIRKCSENRRVRKLVHSLRRSRRI